MPEYIEREKFKNILEAKAEMAIGTPKEVFYNAVKMLELIPTADVVEVVRCCDCEHKQENPDINNTCYLTCNLKYGIRGTIDPTDFCSYGKRKGVDNG